MSIEPGFSGPHLACAFLCEKVLLERDNVPTFVRVVDRFTVPVFQNLPPGVQVPQPVIQLNLVVMLKAGTLGAGKYKIKIIIQKPDGNRSPENILEAFFSGSDDNGVMAVAPLVFPSPLEGLHWIDVYFEQSLITRIPMRVLFQSTPLPFPVQER
ncbi:MAG: hypothetical protein C5B51_23050 [Terriglobia bacterium]|nr:MAG: hypothetical protein C5B51_23050 [Terriglobia bacterium]